MSPGRPAPYRRFRLLARTYPAGPRRAELLDTMLMAAQDAGRRGPTAREIVDVLRHAPRARLGRPGNRMVVAVAVAVAVLCGFVTASLTARLFGETDRPLPTAAEMAGIAELVTPGAVLPPLERHDRVFVNGNGEAQFSQVRYQVDHPAAIPDLRAYDAEVSEKLAAAGWRLGPTSYSGDVDRPTRETLTATRDGWVLTFDNNHHSSEPTSGGWFEVSVRRIEPAGMPVGFAAGALLGMVSGWFLTGWASRRSERHPTASGILALLALLATGNAAFLISYVVRDYLTVADQGFSGNEGPLWSWTVFGDEGLLILTPTILAVVVAAVVLALCRRPRDTTGGQPAPRSVPPRVGWTAVSVAFGLAVITTCTGMGYLGCNLFVAALVMAIVLKMHLARNGPTAAPPLTRGQGSGLPDDQPG
ncbi:hypothetical protein [Micromonospora yangpuensis]|uniref:Uncharacterized protein n=1 Tax=Micromonospora yangpuensis TaxID=683228 RepID=A0A1C6TZD3_9ACTN|nr:hypothetical protein [Micromonospora yangpuensis]GGM21212.1 hypothetical protein GCM10012279_44480 [Micromonospora yangpuensis]SCL47165.1 hypothetical protein GA0070617_0496 [Micromonospora yangpuensis]